MTIEWNVDFDDFKVAGDSLDQEDGRKISEKWRCKACWGGVTGRLADDGRWTGFKCRVCDIQIIGAEAQEEYEAVRGLEMWNGMCRKYGFDAKAQNRPQGGELFVSKRFPDLKRRTQEEVRGGIKKNQNSEKNTLDRKDFPEGTPAALYFEAILLMSSVAQFPLTERRSIGRRVGLARDTDGNTVLDIATDTEKWQQDAKIEQREAAIKMGTNLSTAMLSAFSCELVMKAISLTTSNRAQRTHNLADLYANLPPSSRSRLETDFPEIQQVMANNTKTFSSWRYFDIPNGEQAIRNTTQAMTGQALSKAARVLIDEAEICGLVSEMRISQKVFIDETKEGGVSCNEHIDAKFNFGEAPPTEAELDNTD